MIQFAQGLGRDSENVLLALRREIEQGIYPVRSRFPTAAELCRRFDCSRNTILRALERLSAEGLIESRQGVGSFVLKTDRPQAMSRTVSAMFTFDTDSLIAVQNHALDRGFLLCVYSRNAVGWNPAPERAFLERVRAERHLGLLACLTPTAPRNDDLLRTMAAEGIRILHIEPYALMPPEQNYLLPDYVRGGGLATTTALVRGFKRLIYVGTGGDWPAAMLFRQGVIDALEAHGQPYDPAKHYYDFPTGTGQSPEAVHKLHRYLATCERGTAFICRSEDFCQEIADGLAGRGWRPGADFIAIGPRYLGPMGSASGEGVGVIDFGRAAILERAIECLTQDAWPRVQEWVKPRIILPAGVIQKEIGKE